MFDLISAASPSERMLALNTFIDFWYGPHSPQFEDHDLPPGLPLPLRLFYERNGRRPPVHPHFQDSNFFYEGPSGHHLFPPPLLDFSDGVVKFFMEYQGDFFGYARCEDLDPPVTLRGTLPAGDVYDYGFTARESEGDIDLSLSCFLVTHILLTSIYETQNHERMRHIRERTPEFDQLMRGPKQLIWDAGFPTGLHCPYYFGKVYLLEDFQLAHEFGKAAAIASRCAPIVD